MTTPKAQLQPKSNATLWLLIGILGVGAIGYFYVAPQVRALKDIRLSGAALAADKLAYEVQISQIAALDTRLTVQETALDQLSLAVPDQPAVDELIVALQAIASKSGIVLSSIQPAAEGSTAGVSVLIAARGSYSGLHLFLEELGKNQRPIKVTELALNAASDVTGASLVNASMQLVAATASQSGAAAAESVGQTESPAPSSDAGGPSD